VAAGINDPFPLDLISQPHLAEQADDRVLILRLAFLDHAARDQLIEHLADCLRVIRLEHGDDRGTDLLHLFSGASNPLYWACLISPSGAHSASSARSGPCDFLWGRLSRQHLARCLSSARASTLTVSGPTPFLCVMVRSACSFSPS